jgi:predicted secreted Zn-dependent protease
MQERFYPVAGRSARALNRALATQGPRSAGRAAHALTQWHVSWSYRPVMRGGACLSGRPTVSVEIVTTLPRWTDSSTASDRLLNDWALFLARLRDHESRHQYLALEGGREVLATLSGLTAPTCELLHETAQRAVSTLEASYESRQLLVDESSNYGLSEGPASE